MLAAFEPCLQVVKITFRGCRKKTPQIKLVFGQIMGGVKQQHFGLGFACYGFSNLRAGQFFIKNIFDLVFFDLLHQVDQVFGRQWRSGNTPWARIFQAVAPRQITEGVVPAINDFLLLHKARVVL